MGIKIQKTVPLSVVAASLADEIVAACFSGIAQKGKYGLDAGDQLDEVVDQALSKSGMADDVERLSKIRLQVKVGCDMSGSQYDRDAGRTIVPSITMMRMLVRAFELVQERLPADVFKYSLSLWATGQFGRDIVSLTEPDMSTLMPYRMKQELDKTGNGRLSSAFIDKFLEEVMEEKPWWRGGDTYLNTQLKSWASWEEKYGDPKAHRLDIILTDGIIGDHSKVNAVQAERLSGGKYEGVMLQVGRSVTPAPEGFTIYRIPPQYLDSTVRDFLLAFVQRVF